jgi:hypothetical protein
LLQVAWDSRQDAVTFYDTLLDLLPRVLVTGAMSDTTASSDLPYGRWWSGGQGAVFLRRDLKQVHLVWGNDAIAVEDIGAALETLGENKE